MSRAYHARQRSILTDMSTRYSWGRASLGLLAGTAAAGCCALLVVLAAGIDPTRQEQAVAAAWGSGILALLLAVLAMQEHTDPDDDPRYLATVWRGLRAEWRR